MHRQDVSLVHELGVDALNIVVVHKIVELDSCRHHAVGALDGVGDLKIVMVVVPAVKRLVEGVVGHAVKGILVCPAGIVAVDDLAHEPEIRFDLIRSAAQGLHKLEVQHIGSVQADAVHVELGNPEADHVTDVVADVGILLVELHQQVIAAPVGV